MPRKRGGRNNNGKKAPTTASGARGLEALPDVVLQHILGFLPAREAVRTCVLARRWQELWASTMSLRIAYDDFGDVEELRLFMEHLLLFRGGAPLEAWELRFISDEFSYDDEVRVKLWFRHAIKFQARVLRLVNTARREVFELDDLRLVSQHLMHLELAGVKVKKSTLDLSGCPALEKLIIHNSELSHAMKISSASLKCLSITDSRFSKSVHTQIYAPSLVSLQLHDNFWFKTPVLESMLSLVDASVGIANNDMGGCRNCDSGDCNVCLGIINRNSSFLLLEGLSKVKKLALMSESKMFISEKDLTRCPTFTNLKTLLVCDSQEGRTNSDSQTVTSFRETHA